MSRVLVALDRAEALVLTGQPVTVKDIEPGLWTNAVDADISAQEKLCAALDTDREALVSRMADVIEGLDGADYQAVAGAVLALLENGWQE